MRVLLDTHVFVWWITADRRLSPRATETMTDPEVELLLSTASAWEIVIKSGLGKLGLEGDLESFIPEQLRENSIDVLPVSLHHALKVHSLPSLHKDPFDRLLIAQASVESIPILTGDELIRSYPVSCIW